MRESPGGRTAERHQRFVLAGPAACTARGPILQVEKRDPRGGAGGPQASVAQLLGPRVALRSDQLEVTGQPDFKQGSLWKVTGP